MKNSKSKIKNLGQFEKLRLVKEQKNVIKGGNNSSTLPTSGRLEHTIIDQDIIAKP